MKILVTGGAGFIGSAIARRLLDEGHTVTVIDNFNEYYDVTLKRARQDFFLEGATVVEADITDAKAVEKIFSEEAFDVVCHLAAQAGVRYSIENPGAYVQSNVVGTAILAEAMKQHGVRRMVFASTSSVYGNTTSLPFQESTPADKPISMYAATKRSCELLLYSYASQFHMDITCLRFFTVYGPWGRPDMALFSFTKNIQAGEPIDVYNNGDHRRDFTYIDDIVDGFVRAIKKPLGFEIVNLGNNNPVALTTYIETLEAELGMQAQKNLLPMQQGDVHETFADISKARELLGYEPKTQVTEGVERFVAWYRQFYQK
jgi:UDP-glucuronate 4-epimerase